ncbi:MAG TPA: cytochrome c3 family protein [Kofleriaceae bacterium]|nr:cytochrome c3 family protein [Kofleriaceae bacterium]
MAIIVNFSSTARRAVKARAVVVVFLTFAGCGIDTARYGVTGSVTDTAREPVANATIYAIPAELVTWTSITASDINGATADDFDEPLEGLVDSMGASLPSTEADSNGSFFLSLRSGNYYFYVVPDPKDPVHLPGGSATRRSASFDDLARGGRLDIKVSSQPSSFGTENYVGSGTCIGCHAETQGWMKHAHANGIHEPGKAAALQSQERINLVDAATLAKFAADTTLYFYDFDATRGDDKFKVQEGGTPPATAEFAYRLFKSGDIYEAEFQNLINAATDPVHDQVFKVDFLYGGLIYKQRFISRLNTDATPPTTSGAYFIFPPVQLQPGGTTDLPLGDDRTRWPWLDVRAADYWNTTTKMFKVPVLTQSFDAQCSSCHFTGFSIDPSTLESTAFESSGGIPWKTPDRLVEGNLGCEVCHGPGKEHMQAYGSRPGQFIVEPGYLAAERMMAICGQCHSRPVGNDSLGMHNQPPLNQDNQMMPPGTSRKVWRANYVTRADGEPKTAFWDGGIHSRLNRQQYSDLRKSTKYANPRILVTCTDCHDVHGRNTDPVNNPRGLVASITDNSLCLQCHGPDQLNTGPGAQYHDLHTQIGNLRPDVPYRCVNCHMDQIGKTGAGQIGGSNATVQYLQNDITDHTFIIPRKNDVAVADYTLADASLGKAMPIPYTRSCSNCHVLSTVASKP